jgi:Response regulator containing a CheY-like receiver domain and an HTH DNA-binding domain
MKEKVLLADDHEICRTGLKPLVSQILPNTEFVEASTYSEAYDALLNSSNLTLALVDLNMPGVHCLTDLQKLIVVGRDVPFVVLSASDSRADIKAAFDSGVLGYVVKTQPANIILNVLRLVLSGGIYMPPEILIQPSPTSTTKLTPRQLDVLDLIARGESNKSIARRLHLSEATIKAHLVTILKSLNAKNRTQEVVTAQELGLTRRA